MSINLNDARILSSSQACFLWRIHDSSLRKKIRQFPTGTIRRVGKTWVVTVKGMEAVFGERERGFTNDELKTVIETVENILKKEENYLSGTELFKKGVDTLTTSGFHSTFAQDVVQVITKQMDSRLFYQIYQIDERRTE
ncbi:helix-turn-helix domain-containing protein [Virgibacillus halodenitrificans]|uniref:helix-turn-helix domain-containing protein n=1 Tax=Virgibacillus halodenitrificans TaxID=1482 RepID=UPI001F0914E6|nr:helix-turn-helix domain-containing protein [Virgibacillus halodenitrificans]